MNDKLKNKYIDQFFKASQESAEITSPSEQMLKYLEVTGQIIEDIYEEGYTAGKKAWAKDLNKN